MPKPVKSKPTPRMSDEAVKVKTGKTWKQWFEVLTHAGAKKLSHQEIVQLLSSKFAVGPWWQQMVAVTFEQQSGLRDAHQRPDGYQISVSKTLNDAPEVLNERIVSSRCTANYKVPKLQIQLQRTSELVKMAPICFHIWDLPTACRRSLRATRHSLCGIEPTAFCRSLSNPLDQLSFNYDPFRESFC
jgi:hypothetical protein